MLKVTYKPTMLFSLKKYKDSNSNCQSYEYPTIYTIRCAILSAAIQTEGKEKAKELFYKIKNSKIYIQYPKTFTKNVIKQTIYGRSYYSLKDNLNRDNLLKNNFCTTMGVREYLDVDNIIFYIDNLIPNIEIYLKNIDWIGKSESMVYLKEIKEVKELENILVEWNGEEYTNIYEQYDWDTKTEFDNIYMYSDKYKKRIQRRFMCKINNIILE